MNVGIDDLAQYVPQQYLDLKDLAQERAIEYEKLAKGLGTLKSAIPNMDEDAASMAANAVLKLILQNDLEPSQIGRIYIGTESGIDAAKPVASYVLGMLENYFAPSYGADCFRYCDAADMTFACVAGIDALLNTLDWCAVNPNRIGIVVATDNAKYELKSSGEYTQGAGAVAALVKQSPRLLSIDTNYVGVSCQDVHDFYKPVRSFRKVEFLKSVLMAMNVWDTLERELINFEFTSALPASSQLISFHQVTPLFDGQYSNQCYADRLREAYSHFQTQKGTTGACKDWARIAFHLPYAFHGKRIFTEIFLAEHLDDADFIAQAEALAPDFLNLPLAQQLKLTAQTAAYKQFAQSKMEKGQVASSEIGNIYTASIFMALMSTLEQDALQGNDLAGEKIGFCAYGSGSKSKVFEGVLQPNWQSVVAKWDLSEALASREPLSFAGYEMIHNHLTYSSFENLDLLRSLMPSVPLLATEGFRLAGIDSKTCIRTYEFV